MPTRSRVHLPLLIALLTATLACAPDSVSGNSLAAVGRWTLQSYGGSPLPAVVPGGGTATVEVISGTLELSNDGLYDMVTSYRMTQNGVVTTPTDHGSGNWVDRGGQITLSRGNGVADAAAVYSGGRMTLYGTSDNGGTLLLVYTR